MAKVRLCTLYSGSSANSTFIEVGGSCILIDAGAGVKKTAAALHSLNSGYEKVRGVFLTHEHSDHIGGLKTILKYHRLPVLANRRTLHKTRIGLEEYEACFGTMDTGASAVCDDFRVTSFASSHDSAECVGYVIEAGNKKFGVLTDCGKLSPQMLDSLAGCEVVVLESNHDFEMLMTGPYPYSLKRRVAGDTGHLSNKQCGDGLCRLVQTGTTRVFLAHLSKENNTPDLAVETVTQILSGAGVRVGQDILVQTAPRDELSQIVEF